jgi:hypothetical protein
MIAMGATGAAATDETPATPCGLRVQRYPTPGRKSGVARTQMVMRPEMPCNRNGSNISD